MERFERQIIRAALADLGGDIQVHLSDPQALGKVQMHRFLLAHLLAAREAGLAGGSIEAEVAALRSDEAQEQAALSAAPSAPDAAAGVSIEVLQPYLRDKLQDAGLTVTSLQASLGGFSKQTCVVDVTGAAKVGHRLVLRRDQAGGPVETQAADEFGIIALMHARGLAVPEPLWADREPPFGGTCLVMRWVPGKTAYDATGALLGGDGRDAAIGLARTLGRIHSTPVGDLPDASSVSGLPLKDQVRRMVRSYEEQWGRRRVAVSPTMAAAFAWLLDHVLDSGVPALVHGDASLRNLLVHEGRESAMLDWELWHVGDPHEDLAYCRSDVESFMAWDEFLDVYRQHGGRAFDPAIARYYGVFGMLRNAVFADACLHSFLDAPVPEPKLAYGALALGRKLIHGLAEQIR